MVRRIFVEKKAGYDIEARGLLADLRGNLGISGLENVRVINRYDVSGISDADFARAAVTIFSEPAMDNIYYEDFPLPKGYRVFAWEYLPGQFDQRADSAAQCVQLLTGGRRPAVLTAKLIALGGEIGDDEFAKIESYILNPVEARLASFEKPESLEMSWEVPKNVPAVSSFISWGEGEMRKYFENMGFAMSFEDLLFCQKYFREREHRDPTVTELRVIDTYWSDHCRHTTFLTELSKIDIEEGPLKSAIEDSLREYLNMREELGITRPVTLMDMATIGGKILRKRGLLPDLDESEEINACSIEVPVEVDGRSEPWLIEFKNETHNHPTEIEPVGGAATCLGGAIRDPLSGRAYIYQAMRVTGSGDPTVPVDQTLHGKLPARKITLGAAQGYSSYGNQIGLATGQVTELYDPGYTAKRLEIGAVVGAAPKKNVIRKSPSPGDIVLLLGGATGRDGIGGATGSSKAHTEKSVEVCGAEVQKGNPPTERKLQRLFRNPEASRLIKRCNDFGAGGVSVAIGELAPGLLIDLDKVPRKYEGLDGTELAISESQERMAVVLDRDDADTFISLAEAENLEATPVAAVSEVPRLKMTWRGDTVVDIARDFLDTNGVTQRAEVRITAPVSENYREAVPENLREIPLIDALSKNLERLEVSSQKGLAERFDSSIGAGTVLMPFGGRYQLSPEEAMVAKVPVTTGETDDCTAMAYGFIPGISKYSPFLGAQWAVVESLSKLLCAGADPLKARLTFQEYFERLRLEPSRWGKPAQALLGALCAQTGLGVPAIGGKDSMSGSFENLDVPPTLVSFALAMTKAGRTISSHIDEAGLRLYLLPVPKTSFGAPDYEKLKSLYRTTLSLIESGKILACACVKEGGAAASVLKLCFGEKLGFSFCNSLTREILFAPRSGDLVIAVRDKIEMENAVYLGQSELGGRVSIAGESRDISEMITAYQGRLENVFPSFAPPVPVTPSVPLCENRGSSSPIIKTTKPRVIIPAFPGTNCEEDSARAFERAGAKPEILVIRNLTPKAIEESILKLESSIKNSQIIMLPGGFSGGDEPDGSGKFIATTFRNPRISEAVEELLEKRGGLILGICNGFQALIKLGLVPFGKITQPNPKNPTLTFNTLGRHVSRMVYTRVTSVKSPWLSKTEAGEIHCVPVSHGEGRFVASDELLKALADNGQIATQYVDFEGNPSGDILYNPNGSLAAVEGILSPDGRVFGKMGHSERRGENICKNVPGEKNQKIFESGVAYFN